MSENALLYELLVNKQKVKLLNNKHNDEQSLTFALKGLEDEDNIFDNTNQIFSKYCESSATVKNNIKLFNDFLEAELPTLINKFEKYSIGKTE